MTQGNVNEATVGVADPTGPHWENLEVDLDRVPDREAMATWVRAAGAVDPFKVCLVWAYGCLTRCLM